MSDFTLTGKQIKKALEFVNPDGDKDIDQLDCEIAFYKEGEKVFAYFADYPEEGSMELEE